MCPLCCWFRACSCVCVLLPLMCSLVSWCIVLCLVGIELLLELFVVELLLSLMLLLELLLLFFLCCMIWVVVELFVDSVPFCVHFYVCLFWSVLVCGFVELLFWWAVVFGAVLVWVSLRCLVLCVRVLLSGGLFHLSGSALLRERCGVVCWWVFVVLCVLWCVFVVLVVLLVLLLVFLVVLVWWLLVCGFSVF